MSLHKSYAHTYMPPGRRIIQLHQCVRAYLATNLSALAGWLALGCGARHHHPPDACSRISVDNKKLSVSQVPIYLWLCFRQSAGCLHNTHSATAIAGFLADVVPECLMPGRHLAVRRTACIHGKCAFSTSWCCYCERLGLPQSIKCAWFTRAPRM